MGLAVAISNMKGGTGKTTTAMNLGAGLARLGQRVLLVDADPQSNLSAGLGIDVQNLGASMYEVLSDRDTSIKDVLVTRDGLDIAPSHINMVAVEIELSTRIGRERTLTKALEPVRRDYDFILIDCPPSLGLITINALAAADSVLIPIQGQYYALYGVSQIMQTIDIVRTELNRKLDVLGVILTQVTPTRLAKEVIEDVRKYFGDKVFNTMIHQNIRLAEAPAHGTHIFGYDPICRGAEDYASLASEVMERCRNA
ncbi:MAG: chromosome partitioning protein [Chloroflexi bacterium]|jgi:chromosome partitioning protein|nr:MAG: chromosome partitioning protein [Chloroflexota bacterium]